MKRIPFVILPFLILAIELNGQEYQMYSGENTNSFVNRIYDNPNLAHSIIETRLWNKEYKDILIFREINSLNSVATLLHQIKRNIFKQIHIDTLNGHIEAVFYRDITNYYNGKELAILISDGDNWGKCYYIDFYNVRDLSVDSLKINHAGHYAGSGCDYVEPDGTKCFADYATVAQFDFYQSLKQEPEKLSDFSKSIINRGLNEDQLLNEIRNSNLFSDRFKKSLKMKDVELLKKLTNKVNWNDLHTSSVSTCKRTDSVTVSFSESDSTPRLEYITKDYSKWLLDSIH
ncbi:MAG: hypothetical protein ABJH05_01365 [Fulvivirga sp.]